MKHFINFFILITSFLLISTAHARCDRTYAINAADSYATPIEFGTLNLSSAYLQPTGSVLGHTVVPPSHLGIAPSTVIWTCDAADLPNIYFLVATNGDEPFGGHVEVGEADGLSGVYATWWQYIGLKQSMNGVVFSRYWKKLDIKNYAVAANGRIQIRLMDIPPLEATLYKVSSLPVYSRGSFCYTHMITDGTYKSGTLAGTTIKAACNQPSAYIQLGGNSNVTFPWTPDKEGSDSNTNYHFFSAYGIAYGLNTSSSILSRAETCVARNATPTVNFPAIAATQLRAGATSEANFNVEVECSNTANSGTASNQVAIGFQPSSASYANAQKLNLINANGSSEYLVSDDYTNPQSAKGVGVKIQNSSTGTNMLFLNQYAISGGGASAGWYPVLEGNPSPIGSQQAGYTSYLQQYRAVLTKIPTLDPIPGKVKATATVVVKVQ